MIVYAHGHRIIVTDHARDRYHSRRNETGQDANLQESIHRSYKLTVRETSRLMMGRHSHCDESFYDPVDGIIYRCDRRNDTTLVVVTVVRTRGSL